MLHMLYQWNSVFRNGFCSVVMQQSWQYSLILIWYGWCSLYVWVWRSMFRCLWNHVAPWMLDCMMQMADEANYASLLCCESKKTSHRPARNFTKCWPIFKILHQQTHLTAHIASLFCDISVLDNCHAQLLSDAHLITWPIKNLVEKVLI